MANLKADLLNELRNQKYYEELELLRLAQDPGMNYKSKILQLVGVLEKVAILNNQIGLADGYFQEQQPAPVDTPVPNPNVPEAPVEEVPQEAAPAPAPAVHPGQSHGE